MKDPKFVVKAAFLLAAVAGFALTGAAAVGGDSELQQSVQSKLRNKEFQQVTVSSSNGVVTLKGSVKDYQAKLDAEKKAHKVPGVKEVDDEIEVGGKAIPDAEL